MTRLLLTALMAVLAPAALAQTCTTSWTNPAGGDWSVGTNWNDGVPDVSDTACITLAGTYTVASNSTDRTVAGLVVGGASGTQTLTTQSVFTVSGNAFVRPSGRWEMLNRTPGGADGIYMGGTLLVEGLLVHNGGTTLLDGGGTLDVAPGGRWEMRNQASAGVAARPGTFRLRGTLDASYTSTQNVVLPLDVQGGTVRVSAGRLDLNAGGTLANATVDAAAGAELLLVGTQGFRVSGTLSGAPAGTVYASGGTFAAAPGGATLAVGGTGLQLSGSAFLTSAGGQYVNTGLLRKATTGSNFAGFRSVEVTNRGTVDFTTSFQLLDGAVLRNDPGATVLLSAGGNLSGNGRLDNAGLLLREGDRPGIGGAYNLGGLLRSLPGSDIRSNADRLELGAPSSRTVPDGVTLTGTGRFFVPRELEIEGAVSPGTAGQPLATLTLLGVFRPSQVSGSPRLVVDVDAGGQSDRLDVLTFSGSQNVRLGGALVVRVRPGVVPAVGDQWTVVTTDAFDGVTGQFAQVVAEGAPDGVAFVTERSADGRSLVLRAVATAPGGAIMVSTTTPVGGAVRSIFLTGPGASGVTAARLDCVECLDPGAFGTIPAQVVGAGGLREARFDLTSPRAFGLYSLVVQRPGQPDVVTAVTVRPYLSFTLPTGGFVRGLRVRPAGTGYNWSFLSIGNRTNSAEPAYPFQRVQRPLPSETGLAIATGNAFVPGVVVFYESDTAADPLDPPIVFGRIPAGEEVLLNTGLRIDPDAVLFPGQTPSGPDDPRVPFGEPLPVSAVGAFHASFARSASVVEAALRTTGNGTLDGYLASVDAADQTAVAAGIRNAMQDSGARYLGAPLGLLQRIVVLLGTTAPPPSGLAEAAGPAFDAALKAEATARLADMRAVVDAVASAPASVRALYEGEAAVLLPEFATPRAPTVPTRRGGVAEGFQCNFEDNASGVGSVLDLPELNAGGGGGGAGGSGQCEPSTGDLDPNDKTADTDLRCEFGTVVVSGETVTRCVRYYVPLARADDPIGYTVHFENLAIATEPAEFITITDELDPALDPATLDVLSTSSDSTFSYSVSGQTVTFRFVGIDLPPNVTAPEGEGYVRFRVRPFGALAEGTEIRNDASIVFTFNPPIVTPEVVHLVRQTADLATVVEAPDEAQVGQPSLFRVLVGNLQGDPAEAPTATLTVAGGTILSAVPESGSCSVATPVVCTFADLDSTAVVAINVTVQPASTGLLSVSSVVDTPSFDGFAANDTDGASVTVTGVGTESDPLVPRDLTLSAPRPNPARGAVTLRWGLPQPASVDVRVYDLLGREVARLAEGVPGEAGWHETEWDARSLASGVYVVRLQVGDEARTRRITVLR